MAYSILSDEIKQQLQQERSRLVHDRETIISSVTQEIDRLIEQLDALLETQPATPESKGSQTNGSTATSKPTTDASTLLKQQKRPRSVNPKAKQQAKGFDAKQLQGDFKGMNAADAILKVMREQPDRTFTVDDLIGTLYGTIASSEMASARKSVAAVLMQGGRKGKFEKGAGNPAQYKLQESAAAS